jgi:predicted NACHT family NTPase
MEPTSVMTKLEEIAQQVLDIQRMLQTLFEKRADKDWYSTDEAAKIFGKAEFTVREWCRLNRIYAEKRQSGRGAYTAWVISHREILRYQREGLLHTEY